MKLKHLSLFFLMCCSNTGAIAKVVVTSNTPNESETDCRLTQEATQLNQRSLDSSQTPKPNYIYTIKSIFDLNQFSSGNYDMIQTSIKFPSFKMNSGDYCKRAMLDDSDDCTLRKYLFFKIFQDSHTRLYAGSLLFFKTSI